MSGINERLGEMNLIVNRRPEAELAILVAIATIIVGKAFG
jgi:hypothetical protein